ncbi:MAG TPA: ABC transporter permease [Candidatus Limnocylindria bacterium]|nr:ABC transporter permease [Candidatus Limnocylindria bacterium]
MRTRGRALERALSLFSPLFILGSWEGAAALGAIDTRFFPPPSEIFRDLWQLLLSGELEGHLAASVQRIAIGFLLGAVPGVVLGLAMGLNPLIRAFVQPLVDGTFPIPKVALLPLFIMTLGFGEASKYAIIAVAVVYVVLINTLAGVRNIDRIYFDVGRNYQASALMRFTDIALPGALPTIVAGLRLGMGIAMLVIVAAEFVGARSGIGYLIWTSWQTFQVSHMYVGIMVTAILGFAMAWLLDALDRVLIPWRPQAAH